LNYPTQHASSLSQVLFSDLGYLLGTPDRRVYLLCSMWVNDRWPVSTSFCGTGADRPVTLRPQVSHWTDITGQSRMSHVWKIRQADKLHAYSNRILLQVNRTARLDVLYLRRLAIRIPF